jgi:hypothetical protein
MQLALLFGSWTLSSIITSVINALPPPLPSTLDTLYQPTTHFEIIVSMYDESPTSVKYLLSALQSTPFLSTISPHITIYTKNPSHSLTSLKNSTNASRVLRLPNLGREGGTYLHHIIQNWDSLAEQIMFIQAHAHNIRELIPRINSYLVPDTGFLSIGFAGVSCFCERCSDRWGWVDSGVVPDLYRKIYNATCEAQTRVLLTYKGQFVALLVDFEEFRRVFMLNCLRG